MRPDELDLLELIHFFGPMASIPRVRRISDYNIRELGRILDSLDGYHGLFTSTSPGILRLHDIWAEALSTHLSAQTAALRAFQVASFLESESETPSEVCLAWQGALFRMAGHDSTSQDKYLWAGDIANNKGLPHEALTHYRSAASGHNPSSPSLLLSCRIATALLRTHRPQEALAACTTAISEYRSRNSAEASQLALLHALRADASFRLNLSFSDDLATVLHILCFPARSDHDSHVSLLIGMRLSLTETDTTRANNFLRAAATYASEEHAALPVLLAQLIYQAEHGQPDELTQILNAVERATVLHPQPEWRVTATRYAAMAHRWIGNIDRSEGMADFGVKCAREIGSLDEVFSFAIQCCNMHLDNGDEAKAMQWLQQAKASPKELLSPERSRALLFTTARHMFYTKEFATIIDSYLRDGISP